jgi:uncharacterized metal-binding protein YceD (DUF177 family)
MSGPDTPAKATAAAAPWSVPVQVAEVPATGRRYTIAADEAERRGIAARLGLPAIAELSAALTVAPLGRDGLAVDGTVSARLSQVCVASSDTFESDVVAPVEIRFSPDGRDPDAEIDLEDLIDPEGEDPPDRLVGGRIDLGAIAAEFLALALDPYPRKPGATFEEPAEEPEASPFAALAALKKP